MNVTKPRKYCQPWQSSLSMRYSTWSLTATLLKFSPTNEMTITSKLGTSLKPGWEGAELRAVLVRKAAGVAAKDDKEDEEEDA